MTLKKWIEYVSQSKEDNHLQQQYQTEMDIDSNGDDYSMLYLKDWHLQNILEDRWSVITESSPSSLERIETQSLSSSLTPLLHEGLHQQEYNYDHIKSSKKKTLYNVPEIFAGDIFNPFLLRNGGGDYRFVYWGPKGSSTSIHSDVLHTFSWSFNVFGAKKWIFYPPPQPPSQVQVQ